MSTSQCAPLACELDSRLLPAGVAPAGRPLLTVIVPVFNEAATIDELLRRISESGYVEQVIVVDDGSTDGTQTILERRSSRGEIELYRHEMNRGKGAAVRTALDHARGEYTIVQDGDLEYDPQDYPALLGPLMRREAAAVYGSRYLKAAAQPRVPWNSFRVGVCVLNRSVRWLYGVALTDEATCLKAFPTATLRAMQLASERFELCAELTAKACRMGVSILEVPIHYQPRTVAQGKKIRWRDGWKSVAMLWRCRHWTCRQPPRGDPADDRRGVPAVAGSRKPVISLVIPAYNECLRLPAFLKSARQYLDGEFAGNYEVIVVDDGSDDGTVAFLEDASAGWPQLSFVRHLENQGKGAAVRSGMRVAQGDYWLFADADGATPMAEERKLRGAIQRGADLAIGSRTLEAHATRRHRRAGRRMIGWLFRCCCRLVVGIRATDTQCGFKMFRADAGAWLFANLSERGFAFDLELLLRARAARYNLAEVPVAWNEIPGSKVRLFRDSLRMLKSLFAMRRRARSWPTAGRRGLRPIGIEPGVLVK